MTDWLLGLICQVLCAENLTFVVYRRQITNDLRLLFDNIAGRLNQFNHYFFFYAQIRAKLVQRHNLVGLFSVRFLYRMMDPQALPVALAGDAGNVFGVNADSVHLICFIYALAIHFLWG